MVILRLYASFSILQKRRIKLNYVGINPPFGEILRVGQNPRQKINNISKPQRITVAVLNYISLSERLFFRILFRVLQRCWAAFWKYPKNPLI